MLKRSAFLLILTVFVLALAVEAYAAGELWVQRYNGPGNWDDYTHAIAVDSIGNVYVTGSSYGSGTDLDYATVKYDSSGNQLWVQRYNGPGNGHDIPQGIAVDSNENAYVTGYSTGTESGGDYATVKYDSGGNQVWVQRYHGPGNGDDWAYAIAVDANGNVLLLSVRICRARRS